ncbi:hypothetical protein GCM10022212_24290 [Actimicrobium antarcticum]|uniref:Uncharacterized protein n=1 Tax=Actimicrobium antarcticum TaxID=1051899 RepID=A0ABP7TGB4_9BURK
MACNCKARADIGITAGRESTGSGATGLAGAFGDKARLLLADADADGVSAAAGTPGSGAFASLRAVLLADRHGIFRIALPMMRCHFRRLK